MNLPPGFDWKVYLYMNFDLQSAGIATEEAAVQHYLRHGQQERRIYRRVPIKPDSDYEGGSVFVCGTSPEIEVLSDRSISESISSKYKVLCINTSFHYFDSISSLFLNGRFSHVSDHTFLGKRIDRVYTSFDCDIKAYPLRYYRVAVSVERFCPEIHFDLNKVLPHGPTTLLDVVFPFCVFNKVSNIYILGAEYMRNRDSARRHSKDNFYVDRSVPSMDAAKEMEYAHRKLQLWKACFDSMGINCFALSERSETPFQKIGLGDILR